MNPDFVVFSNDTPQGVRFVLIDRNAVVRPDEVVPSNTLRGMVAVMSERVASLTGAPLTEEEARRTLTDAGVADDDCSRLISQAVQRQHWTRTEFLIESPTEIGYRNAHGQVVIRKTDAIGTQPLHRVYVVCCANCRKQYGANGGDVHDCRCPVCQGGAPGLALSEDDVITA